MKLIARLSTAAAAVALSFALAPAAGAQTVLKLGYTLSKDSHYALGATVFCDEIERGTAGRYKCQQFPASALGGEREMVEAVQLGTQDLVLTSTGPVGNFVPEIKILDIPFLFRDYGHARRTLDGQIGQDLLAKFPSKGLVALAWTENGFRHMTNNKRPIQQASDASGLKMRTMENKVHMDGYKSFGIQPTPMPMPELFGALQQGVVDGQENPIPVIISQKLYQVQKHMSLTGHVYSPAILLMSPAAWGKLSEADKKAFKDAAAKSAAAQRARVADDEARGLAQIKKDGVQVVEQVNAESFRKAVAPAYERFAKEFGADRIAAIQAVK